MLQPSGVRSPSCLEPLDERRVLRAVLGFGTHSSPADEQEHGNVPSALQDSPGQIAYGRSSSWDVDLDKSYCGWGYTQLKKPIQMQIRVNFGKSCSLRSSVVQTSSGVSNLSCHQVGLISINHPPHGPAWTMALTTTEVSPGL